MQDRELLIRIDEQVSAMKDTLSAMKRSLDEDYVRKEEFRPIRNFVYGTVGVITTAIVGGIVALISAFHK